MREALIVWGGWSGHEPEPVRPHRRARCSRGTASRSMIENTTEAFADPAIARHRA